MVSPRARHRTWRNGWRAGAGFGVAQSPERTRRRPLVQRNRRHLSDHVHRRTARRIRRARRAVSLSQGRVRSASWFAHIREPRCSAGRHRLLWTYVGAVRDVDVVRRIFCGRASRAWNIQSIAHGGIRRVCGHWSRVHRMLGRGRAGGSVGTHAQRSFVTRDKRCVRGQHRAGCKAFSCFGNPHWNPVGVRSGGGLGAIFDHGHRVGGSTLRGHSIDAATRRGIYANRRNHLARACAARIARLGGRVCRACSGDR